MCYMLHCNMFPSVTGCGWVCFFFLICSRFACDLKMMYLTLVCVALLTLHSHSFIFQTHTYRGKGKGLTAIPAIHSTCYSIDLSMNAIKKVPKNSFRNQTKCTQIYLCKNLISIIEPDAFCGVKHLNTLLLGDNKLTVLESGIFAGINNLKILDLKMNNLSTLSEELFSDLHWTLTLIMSSKNLEKKGSDNPWNCQSLCWLQEEMKAGEVKFWVSGGHTYKPLCADGTNWNELNCGKYVRCPFHRVAVGHL